MEDLLLRRALMAQKTGSGDELPAGAIPCDMICSNGYSGFVDSGIVPSRSMSFDIDATIVRPASTASFPIGYYIDNIRYAPICFDTAGTLQLGYNGWHNFTNISTITVGGYFKRRYLISVTDTEATAQVYKDGVLDESETITYDETAAVFSSTYTLGLLGRKTSQSAIAEGAGRGGFGRVKFYDDANFGHLIADFIPCYYNNAFGFWDTVSQTFKTGTGVFGYSSAFNTAGWIPNCRNNISNSATFYSIDYRGEEMTCLYEIPDGCSRVRFNAGNPSTSSANYALFFFDSSLAYKGFWNYTVANREVNNQGSETAKYIRMSMQRARRDTCYIYDLNNDQYIWKGASVITQSVTGYSISGNPTIENNILTPTNNRGFIYTNVPFNLTAGRSWKIQVKVRLHSHQQYREPFAFVNSDGSQIKALCCQTTGTNDNRQYALYLSNNGSSWNIASSQCKGNFPATLESWFIFQLLCTWNGSKYVFKLGYPQNDSWTSTYSVSSLPTSGLRVAFGGGYSNSVPDADIDLSECKIWVDEQLWWSAI